MKKFNHLSVFALIGERYLDTKHSRSYLNEVDAELKIRGIVGLNRLLLEYIAASALWWNLIWWEWIKLDTKDILFGWLSNAVAFLLLGLSLWRVFGPLVALPAVILVHLYTLRLGVRIRQK